MNPYSVLRFLVPAAALLALAACGKAPGSTSYFARGTPESLIDVSSELVNLNAASSKDVAELSHWIEKDQPTRAELHCAEGSKDCAEARKILTLSGVPVVEGAARDNSVMLIYERILARDCEARFVDNRNNSYNTNHKNFGCAISSNMVQQITDKQEIVSPSVSDNPAAVRAVNDYRRAYTPRHVVDPYSIEDSLAAKAKTQ